MTNGDDLDKVFRLRYECYRAENSIPRNEDRVMSDSFDESDNCVHVAVEMDDTVVAAVRLHLVSRLNKEAPTIEVFPEIMETVDAGNTLLDPTRFVVNPEARKARLPLHFLALRIPFLATSFYDVDVALAPVRTEHSAFYLRYLGYEVYAPPRQYPGLKKPVCLLTAKVKEHRDEVLHRYPFFGKIESIPQSEINFPRLRESYVASGRNSFRAA
ncbi:N-acyl amino acid synthase FeeM domain-containing protein [Maritimibacter dapengensis]|nr:GNAT family N-acyltransferase [Maritimibacter dapengensis]